MKFSNRLEAYLSWISTGIKPEDFDDEPRNMTEYWLQGEADRLDRMSGNEAPVATRSLKKGAGDEKYDYADLENKPIQPYEEGEELVENKYYFTLPEVEHPVKNDEITLDDISNMNKEAFLADIPNFTYSTGEMEAIVTVGSTTPSTGEHDFNVFMGAMKKDLLGEQDEDIVLIYMFYPVYASKHKNSSASGPFGSTIYFDENGWIRQMNDTPATYEMIVEQFKEMIKDTKLYYTSGHCDDAFEITTPANIFQYVDGEQKSLIVEGEAISAGLYNHQLKIAQNNNKDQIFANILSSSSEAFTVSSLADYLVTTGPQNASGWVCRESENKYYSVINIQNDNSNLISLHLDNQASGMYVHNLDNASIADIIIKL